MPPRTSSASSRLRRSLPLLLLAAVTYLPLVFTQPGQVGADTKTYLYLDPGRLLRDAAFLWDPGVGLGGVTHQVIGYLWPMGPFYWFFDLIGVPDWFAPGSEDEILDQAMTACAARRHAEPAA